MHGGRATVEQTQLVDHSAGAISVTGGNVNLVKCQLKRNRAHKGGAVRISGGSLSAMGTAFEENIADVSGGALQVDGTAKVMLSDETLLVRNQAPKGHSIQLCDDDVSRSCDATLSYTLPAPPGRFANARLHLASAAAHIC